MSANYSVLLKLEGLLSKRAAIGASLTIQAGKLRKFSEVLGGSSYLAQNDLRLHFGLAGENKLDSVEIRRPRGKVEILKDLAADYIYAIVEGKGVQSSKPLPSLATN